MGHFLDRAELTRLFGEIDRRLEPTPDPTVLVVVGGAALAFLSDVRATRDVDHVSDDVPEAVRRAVVAVAEAEGLAPDWLNNAAKGFTPRRSPEPMTTLFAGQALIIKSCSPEYLLAMKLFAARELDLDDTVLLMSKTSLATATELLDLVETAYQPRPIETKVQYFIAEAVHRYELTHPTPSHEPDEPDGPDLEL